MSESGPRRDYRSPARQEQADRTKASIVEAMARQVLATGSSEISVPTAATEAGVGVRTVYHYFPDQAARDTALAAWIDEHLRIEVPLPTTADELPGYGRRRVAKVGPFLPLLRAQSAMTDDAVRAIRTQRRTALVKRLLRAMDRPPQDVSRVAETISFLLSGTAARALIDEHGLNAAKAGDSVAQLISALLSTP